MNTNMKADERDKVLLAFHQACERPTAKQIIEWIDSYPQYADDIRAHAAVSRDWAAQEGLDVAQPDDIMLARAHSRALNILYSAEVAASKSALETSQSFHDLAKACDKEVFQIASDLDISRSVLADLFNGWMKPPIHIRLVDALVTALAISRSRFEQALQYAVQNPRIGHAKANELPKVIARGYDEIVRESNMTSERKSHWLGEI